MKLFPRTKVTQSTTRDALQFLQEALSKWCAERDIHCRVGAATLTDLDGASFRIELFASEQDGWALTPERHAFCKTPPEPLKAEHCGCFFRHGGKLYRVMGYKAQGAPRSVVCVRSDGAEIRFTPSLVAEKLKAYAQELRHKQIGKEN